MTKHISIRNLWRKLMGRNETENPLNIPNLELHHKLFEAAVGNDIEAVKDFLQRGASPEVGSVLMKVVWKGYKEVVRSLLDYGANANNWDPDTFETPLMYALDGKTKDHLEIARLLIEKGADVKKVAFDRSNWTWSITPLNNALKWRVPGYKEIVRLLLEKGADPEKVDRWGDTPLINTATNSEGDPDVARLLLDHGANVNGIGRNGQTALMRAAETGALDIARILLKRGADITLSDNEGRTALDFAKLQRQAEMVRLLKEYSAQPPQKLKSISPKPIIIPPRPQP